MFVGVARFVLQIPGARSLKDRRKVVKSFKDRVRARLREYQSVNRVADAIIDLVGASSVLGKLFIGIAVKPPFARLCRCNHRMASLAGMFRGVAIGRIVAAEGRAALLTGAEVNPVRARLHAFLTFAALRLFDRVCRPNVRASLSWH